jgi:hypothetical protein
MKNPISILLALLLSLLSAPLHAATVNGMLYTSAGSLRVVGFDGSGFTGSFSTLATLSPDWTGMALLFAPEPPPPPPAVIPLPAAGWLLLAAIIALPALRRRCRAG